VKGCCESLIEKLEGIAHIACFLAYFAAPGNGVDENFGLWRGAKQILDSFSIFSPPHNFQAPARWGE
jgi:hypothetical protein